MRSRFWIKAEKLWWAVFDFSAHHAPAIALTGLLIAFIIVTPGACKH